MSNTVKKKRVGILTFHRFLNYGGLLQAYALCETINKLGADCEIIDYRCKYLEDVGNSKLFQPGISLGRNVKKISTFSTIKYKEKVFREFINKYVKTSKGYASYQELNNLNGKYDLFITGSDQVWNPVWPYDKAYFLDFVADTKQKISYAASLGDKPIPKNLLEQYKERLCSFEGLAVRELSDKESLEALTGKEIAITLDPVLLLEKSDWERLIVPVKEKKYCLIYTVNEPEGLVEKAREYARQNGLELIYLNPSFKQQYKLNNGKKIKKATPQEFISYIYNAEAVYTNSFHGTAFSVCFGKKLYVETNSFGKVNKRAKDLLELINKSEGLTTLKQASYDYLRTILT